MKKYLALIVVAAALIVGGGIYYINKDKTNIESNENIVIGYPTLRIALPVFVAQEKGYFKEQGLNVTLKGYETAQPMMDALVSGKIDIGGFCALPITFGAMARSKTDLIFLGGMFENDLHQISIMIVKKDSKIESPADLAGKRIGILPTRAYEVWLQQILADNGIKPTDVVIRHIAPNLQSDALQSGAVDALFTNDPAATITLSSGVGKALSNVALVPKSTKMDPFYFGSFNIRKDFADANPEVVSKIAAALDKASTYINANPKAASKAMINYLPKPHQKFVPDFPPSKFKLSNEVSNADLKMIKDYYLDKKVLPVNIDTSNLQYGN